MQQYEKDAYIDVYARIIKYAFAHAEHEGLIGGEPAVSGEDDLMRALAEKIYEKIFVGY